METFTPLLTDQYQLTMAYAYWKLGMAEQESVFQLSYRTNPFQGNYGICCGLADVIEFLCNFKFASREIDYLHSLKGKDDKPLFPADFLNYLAKLKFSCDIHAILEGTLVFPNEALIRIQGPILQCQLLETPLINLVSFASLCATKASRVCHVAGQDPVVEFGLRRAQGPDGGLTASRAAYIGGCIGTSNVLAGKKYGIPVLGTQAHSWIMAFPDELSAFRAFASVMNSNTTLLVDTYDTVQGVKNAIKVGEEIRKNGEELGGIRLDSGDLDQLSKKARKLLDEAGFTSTQIFASGDLDENIIAELKQKKAPIDAWGVGTRLSTCYDQPALNAIYKLGAIKERDHWIYKMKISNQPDKMTIPGIHQIRRYVKDDTLSFDIIYDTELGLREIPSTDTDQSFDLLVPIFSAGNLIYQSPSTERIRDFCTTQRQCIASLPERYPVYLDHQVKEIQKKILADYFVN